MNSVVKTIEGFASWTCHTKSLPKFYTIAFYLTLTRPFSITRLGSNQVNQQQLKSSKNLCTLGSLMTPTNDVSLEIQRRIQTAKRTAQTSAIKPPFTPDKIHHSQDLDPLSPALWQWNVSVDQKVLRTIFGPKIENGVNRRRYNHELDKEFDSPIALNFTKTSKLSYAGHMIRRPEDLPQKALFRAKPNGRRNQGRPKSKWADGVNSDWTHCVQLRQTWRNLLQQTLTRYWLMCHISK
jgi:hypothetical protein